MSYYEQAERLNKVFSKTILFTMLEEDDKKDLIDAILSFGQVAKFRCRSNIAYDNFAKEVFKNIAELERTKLEGHDFEVLQVKQ